MQFAPSSYSHTIAVFLNGDHIFPSRFEARISEGISGSRGDISPAGKAYYTVFLIPFKSPQNFPGTYQSCVVFVMTVCITHRNWAGSESLAVFSLVPRLSCLLLLDIYIMLLFFVNVYLKVAVGSGWKVKLNLVGLYLRLGNWEQIQI